MVLQLTALERTMVLPEVQAEAWVVLLDKPDGGDRPIALLPFLYRVLLRCRKKELDTWNLAYDAPWDATAKGRGAEQAAMEDELEIEAVILSGDSAAGTFI